MVSIIQYMSFLHLLQSSLMSWCNLISIIYCFVFLIYYSFICISTFMYSLVKLIPQDVWYVLPFLPPLSVSGLGAGISNTNPPRPQKLRYYYICCSALKFSRGLYIKQTRKCQATTRQKTQVAQQPARPLHSYDFLYSFW